MNLELLIWIGAAVTLAGLGGIVWCIFAARAAKAESRGDDALLRARMQRVVSVNMGALLASMLGLMMVVAGVFLAR
ncbi:hypothetical protein DRW48_15305 [Paracoccus suum]|uniref:Uncharacterized protein n=1 Tax=Paracoccus suum TaxID=2259340 RepID=A0A344PNA6_9RHOB|nr:hypothetical protein [Paracoccus suum]AXC50861.1 hypothetical protein DRW48_15305 [Paracoccus suum]